MPPAVKLAAVFSVPPTLDPDIIAQEIVRFPSVWIDAYRRKRPNRAVRTKGGAQQHLGHEAFGSHLMPVPPIPEQQEIVCRVESLFALANQIEARFAQARAQVEKLTPSLLARAFRGELVPQDPNDEPASAFLKRIRLARMTA